MIKTEQLRELINASQTVDRIYFRPTDDSNARVVGDYLLRLPPKRFHEVEIIGDLDEVRRWREEQVKGAYDSLDNVVGRLKNGLGQNLHAVWLKGSLPSSNWTPDWSDIDIVLLLGNETLSINVLYDERFSIDFLTEEELTMPNERFKLGDYRDHYAILQAAEYGKAILGRNFLQDIEVQISPQNTFEFYQWNYYTLRRNVRVMVHDDKYGFGGDQIKSRTKANSKTFSRFLKRAINLDPRCGGELMPYPEDVLESVKRVYPAFAEVVLDMNYMRETWTLPKSREDLLEFNIVMSNTADILYRSLINS